MHQRAALNAGENSFIKIEFLVGFLVAEDHTASGSAQCLVGGGGHYIRIGNGTGMKACCHKACDMCHIYHQYRTDFIRYFTELFEINGTCICRSTCNDHLGSAFQGQLSHSVIIQETVVIHAVRYYMEIFTGHIDG